MAYELDIWDKLTEKVEIIVSSIVARKESLFYSRSEDRVPEAINLKELIKAGKIKELSATRKEISAFLKKFDRVFVSGLHDGEIESLSLILHRDLENTFFCSSDAIAIQALAMIGHSNNGASMETLLKKTGLQKRLRIHFKDKYFKEQIKKGVANLVTGEGLKR
jgi:hypothetical protein